MPYSVVDQGTVIRVTFSGAVTGEDFHALLHEVQSGLAARREWPNNLIDLRAVDPSRLNFNDLLSVAKAREMMKPPNPIRTALVVDSPAMTGFARMYQHLTHNPSLTVEVFADVAAAERWLTAA